MNTKNKILCFGMLMNGGATSVQPFKYSGKELDRMHGLNWYDHGARMSDPALGRWHVVDPLAEKYYDVSPYVMCGNDPVNFVDKDGRKIIFSSGVSETYINHFKDAVNYLRLNGCGELYEKLMNSPIEYTIVEFTDINKGNCFDSDTKEIYWNPYKGIRTSTGAELSPCTLLNHEFDHAELYDRNPEEFKNQTKPFPQQSSDSKYGNPAEKHAIIGTEQKTAVALHEINENEKTRYEHFDGTAYKTVSPITNESAEDEVIISKNK